RWLLLDALFAGKYRCPHCQTFEERDSAKSRLVKGDKVLCADCGRWWSPFNSTVLRGMQFSPGGLVLLILLSQTVLNQKQIAAALDCHPATVRTWLRKLGLRQDREDLPDQDKGPGLFNQKEEPDHE
ncbi:MAG: helix-turn-helix domain-containing protein, partial [Pseudomonadota bacterium]